MINKVLELLLTLTVAGSVFVALTNLLPKRSPARWRYRLSKIAILFYLLPIVFFLSWVNKHFIQSTTKQADPSVHSEAMISGLSITRNVALLMLTVWAIVAMIYLTFHLYNLFKFNRKLKQTSTILLDHQLTETLSTKKQELHIKTNVALKQNSYIHSPILVGIWKPTIYIPTHFLSQVDMSMVFHHELIHLKRKDLSVKALTLIISSIHWFNPFVHILRKHIQFWSELSCDDEVVRDMSFAQRKRYGETLMFVSTAVSNVSNPFYASLSDGGQQLKERLMVILSAKKLNRKMLLFSVITLIMFIMISTAISLWSSKYTPIVTNNTNVDSTIKIVEKPSETDVVIDQQIEIIDTALTPSSSQDNIAADEIGELRPVEENQPLISEVMPIEEYIDLNSDYVSE